MHISLQQKQAIIDQIKSKIGFPYKENGFDPKDGGFHCWGFFIWGFKVASEILEMPSLMIDKDIYVAEKNWRMLGKKENPQFLDVTVMRNFDLSDRHVGLMLDRRWFMHCSHSSNGVACSEITRDPYRLATKYYGRHKEL